VIVPTLLSLFQICGSKILKQPIFEQILGNIKARVCKSEICWIHQQLMAVTAVSAKVQIAQRHNCLQLDTARLRRWHCCQRRYSRRTKGNSCLVIAHTSTSRFRRELRPARVIALSPRLALHRQQLALTTTDHIVVKAQHASPFAPWPRAPLNSS
jgi:hypothetical protein